jgi:hypothetical protein
VRRQPDEGEGGSPQMVDAQLQPIEPAVLEAREQRVAPHVEDRSAAGGMSSVAALEAAPAREQCDRRRRDQARAAGAEVEADRLLDEQALVPRPQERDRIVTRASRSCVLVPPALLAQRDSDRARQLEYGALELRQSACREVLELGAQLGPAAFHLIACEAPQAVVDQASSTRSLASDAAGEVRDSVRSGQGDGALKEVTSDARDDSTSPVTSTLRVVGVPSEVAKGAADEQPDNRSNTTAITKRNGPWLSSGRRRALPPMLTSTRPSRRGALRTCRRSRGRRSRGRRGGDGCRSDSGARLDRRRSRASWADLHRHQGYRLPRPRSGVLEVLLDLLPVRQRAALARAIGAPVVDPREDFGVAARERIRAPALPVGDDLAPRVVRVAAVLEASAHA